MHILIRASEEQKNILLHKSIASNTVITWFVEDLIDADAYTDLLFEDKESVFDSIKNKPVIVNAVIKTCSNLPNNFCRINGWNTFLEKEKLEAATLNDDLKPAFESVLNELGFKVWFVNDIAGMIAARSIAMIINEAYFGLQDEISTKEQIDIAMKLGTNYPFGPFEWAEKIGLKKLELLLQELYKTDERYKPCALVTPNP
jgi:3-hydroxybutyryl-CoA dehydrogenase